MARTSTVLAGEEEHGLTWPRHRFARARASIPRDEDGGKMQRKRKLVKGTHFVANAWGWRGWTALKIWSLESKPPVRLSCNQAIPGLWLALSTWALVSSHCRLRMADLPYFLSVDPVPVPCSLFLVPGKTAYILTSKALDLVFVSEVYSFLV